jgi:single-strand DNA-binding protein
MNRVILKGTLTADPDIRHKEGSDLSICRMRLATNEYRKGTKYAEYHSLVAFGTLADTCKQYLQKGRDIMVEGSIRNGTYTDKNGVERFSSSIVVNQMEFADRKGKPQEASDEVKVVTNEGTDVYAELDDIPF